MGGYLAQKLLNVRSGTLVQWHKRFLLENQLYPIRDHPLYEAVVRALVQITAASSSPNEGDKDRDIRGQDEEEFPTNANQGEEQHQTESGPNFGRDNDRVFFESKEPLMLRARRLNEVMMVVIKVDCISQIFRLICS